MPQVFYAPQYQALSSSGAPLPGAKLHFFSTGTTNGQTVFNNINLRAVDIDRIAAVINGKQRPLATPGFQHTGGGLYTVTLRTGAGANPGDNIVFHGARSLENIQFNSMCDGGLALGNICEGTGDSNIVIGTDYHDGVLLVPGGPLPDEDDYPRHIVVKDNILRTAFASSVNMSQCIGGIIGGNDCSGFAIAHDDANGPFYCAVFCGGGDGVGDEGRFHVQTNTIYGDNTRTTYGVGGWETTDSVASQSIDFRRRPTKKHFDRQNFVGPITAHYFMSPASVSVERKFDVSVRGSEWIEYPSPLQALLDAAQSVNGIPNNNDYWDNQVITGPEPVARDSVEKLGGTASAQVKANKEWQARPKAFRVFANKLVKVSFWAKNSGATQGRLEVFYDHGGDDAAPQILMVVRSTSWEEYELILPVTTIDDFFFRVVGGTSDATNFQYIRIQSMPLNIA